MSKYRYFIEARVLLQCYIIPNSVARCTTHSPQNHFLRLQNRIM